MCRDHFDEHEGPNLGADLRGNVDYADNEEDGGDEDDVAAAEGGGEERVDGEGDGVADGVDALLSPHGRLWTEIDAVIEQNVPDHHHDSSRINWRGVPGVEGMRSPEQYFYHLFPMTQLDSMVRATDEVLSGRRLRLTTKAELLRWIGIRAAAALEKRRGPIHDWFEAGEVDGSLQSFGNYAIRFGMSESRFKVLTACLRLRVTPDEDVGDPWYCIRQFIEAFNELRKRVITLGQYITVDECMSAFKALGGNFKTTGLPHMVKIAWKP